MCLRSHAKLQAPTASPEICKADGTHFLCQDGGMMNEAMREE